MKRVNTQRSTIPTPLLHALGVFLFLSSFVFGFPQKTTNAQQLKGTETRRGAVSYKENSSTRKEETRTQGAAIGKQARFGLAAQQSAPALAFSTDTNNLLLSLTYIHHMLADQDSTPVTRIYGDGRVRVHYPSYMQLSGDYELRLTPVELHQLLFSLAETGAMDFDARGVGQLRRLEVEQLNQQGILFHISDSTEMIIEVHLAWYEAPGTSVRIHNFQNSIRWSNVAQEAQLLPHVSDLQGLAEAEQLLRSILERDDLRRIEHKKQ